MGAGRHDAPRLGGLHDDAETSIPLLRASADAGEAPAMNILGVIARQRDDAEAVMWFGKAAMLHHGYGLYNLGRMYWEGRGGLTKDHAEAVRLWRKAAFYENPWGRFALAESLENGDGTPANTKEALDLYRAVAAQNWEPDAKHRAADAVTRLKDVVR